jgi:hypothetical protein
MAAGNLATIVLSDAGDAAGGVMIQYLPAFFFEVIAGGWLLFKGVGTHGISWKMSRA